MRIIVNCQTSKLQNTKVTFRTTWQPPIMVSLDNGANLLLKKPLSQEEPNEGCVLTAGWEVLVQTAVSNVGKDMLQSHIQNFGSFH